MNVLLLGAGKMLEAILVGLKDTQDLSSWGIYSPSGTSAEKLAILTGANWVKDLDQVEPDYVFVGCKPQQLKDLKLTIGERFKNSVFVSVLAAVSESDQMRVLGIPKLVRVMPNIPVKYKKGVCLISSTSAFDEAQKIEQLLSHVGRAIVVKEHELEELTLLTGSGPAFFYEFAQNLASSFTSLNQVQREELASAVMAGSAESATRSQESLETMINAVTSKGGVTIAVLDSWRGSKLIGLIKSGLEAGWARSKELARGLSQN